jgi:DNA-binding transcriptional LysR family regulator
MKRKIDLIKAIRTFILVAEEQSFSRASQRLSLVVSAVSRQVSDLEAYFDCQLLHRTTRAMHLTAEGIYYLEQFEELVERLDSLENRADSNQKTVAGHLRITAPPDAEQLGITYLVSEFIKRHPAVKISCLLVNRYVNIVEEGIDLAIRVGELPDSRMVARRFAEMKVLYVASPDYLAAHGTPNHPKKLGQHNCVIDSSIRQPCRWPYSEDNVERHVTVSGPLEVNHGNIVADYSAAGHGIAFLPDFLAQPYLDRGALVSILDSYRVPPIPVSLVYSANRIKNPALSELVRYFLGRKP